MATGSAGVLYALHSYLQYVKIESVEAETSEESQLLVIEDKLNQAIEANISLVNKHKMKDECPSFYKSKNVGLFTLKCLRMLESKNIDIKRVRETIKKKIIPLAGLCEHMKDLTHGAAGYLYALLLLDQKLKEKLEPFQIASITTMVQETIIKVVEIILKYCKKEGKAKTYLTRQSQKGICKQVWQTT
jgi:hypothetical protein